MKRNEKKIVRDTFIRLKAEVGGFWWKVHGSMFQIKGLPDICGCVKGLYVHIEAKDGNNKPSPIQLTRIKQIREQGGLSFVFWDVDTAIRRIKKHVKECSLQSPKKGSKLIQKSKTSRIIYGARDWEDNYSPRLRRRKKKETK